MKTTAEDSPLLRVSRDSSQRHQPRGGMVALLVEPSSGEPGPGAISLPKRKVIRVEKKDGVRWIHVRQGVVWLTGTPAREDVLVRAGEELGLSVGWPFVLEALSDARVELMA